AGARGRGEDGRPAGGAVVRHPARGLRGYFVLLVSLVEAVAAMSILEVARRTLAAHRECANGTAAGLCGGRGTDENDELNEIWPTGGAAGMESAAWSVDDA